MTTSWADARGIIDPQGSPVNDVSGNGQAILLTHGNRTATRSIQQIMDETGYSYGTVQKALKFWENRGIIRPIKTHERNRAIDCTKKSGRPVKFVRYEIHPKYVWCGHNYLGLAYELNLMDNGEFECD